MSARRLEHGTPEGYNRGCTDHDTCPALPVHGLTCWTAHIRLETGERCYLTLYGQHLPAAAIARKLGLAPPPLITPPSIDDDLPISPTLAPTGPPTMPTPKPPQTPKRSPKTPTPEERSRAAEKHRQDLMATPEGRAAIRKWANANGHPVSARGKIPVDVLYAYADAQTTGPKRPPVNRSANGTKYHTPAPEPITAAEHAEALDQTRARINDEKPATAVDTNAAEDDTDRPEWATVAATTDPDGILAELHEARTLVDELIAQRDQARSLAARLMLENTEQEHALELVLRKWNTAREDADNLALDAARLIRRQSRTSIIRSIEYGRTVQQLRARIAELEHTRRPLINWRRR